MKSLPRVLPMGLQGLASIKDDKEFEALGSDDDKPMLICLHGLSGGSYEIYLRAVLKPLLEAGWEAAVVNSRGCAESKLTTGILYNARATWDARQFIRWARLKWPNRKLFGIGFSLGANILTNVCSAANLFLHHLHPLIAPFCF